jgi:hypothetical protein
VAKSRAIRAEVAALLLAAGVCGAQTPDSARLSRNAADSAHVDRTFHGHGFDETGGLHIGSPALMSAAMGAKYWLGDIIPGAVFADAEPGILAFRFGAGYQIYDERVFGAGAALSLVRLTGWRDALGVARGVQYMGGEFALSGAFAFTGRAGAYAGRGVDGQRLWLGTIDFGIGF